MSVKDDLVAAKALINTPEKWAHEPERRRARGGDCLCAYDAIAETAEGGCFGKALTALESAIPATFPGSQDSVIHLVAQYNDSRPTTHADIMALFDRAIAAAEGSPE